jgi:hypothetical protein
MVSLKRSGAIVVAAVGLSVALGLTLSYAAFAADKAGSDVLPDLEERIAELESTTARKGTRKVSLEVYGQVNRALALYKIGDESEQSVIENSAEPTRLGVKAVATIRPGLKAGANIELGLGEDYEKGRDENALYTRYAYVFIESNTFGAVSLGLASEATDGISQLTRANTAVAAPLLSVKPATIDDSTDVFDGSRRDLVRYDTPVVFNWLQVSAAWFSNDGGYDIAARSVGTLGEVKFAAGLGYKEDKDAYLLWNYLGVETQTFSGSASVLHIPTGVFANAAYGNLKADDFGYGEVDLKAWHVQAGLERKVFEGAGATTVFVEYLTGDLDLASTNVGDASFYGAGIIQNFGGAVDVYATARHSEDIDATLGLVGARVAF